MTRYNDDATGVITGGISSWTENRSYRHGYAGEAVASTSTRFRRQPRPGRRPAVRRTRQRPVERTERHDHDHQRHGRPSAARRSCPYHQGAKVTGPAPMSRTRFASAASRLNLGLRYDYSKASFPSFPLLDAAGNATGECPPPTTSVYHWSTFSPRFGVNYKLTESTVVKAHFGRYYKELEEGEFRPAVPSITPAFEFGFDAAAIAPTSSRRRATPTCASTGNEGAIPDQYMVQFEQELMRNSASRRATRTSAARTTRDGRTSRARTRRCLRRQRRRRRDGRDHHGLPSRVDPASRVFLQTNPEGCLRATGAPRSC